jgi:hypothetical protein
MDLPKSVCEICFSPVGIELRNSCHWDDPEDEASSHHVVLENIFPSISGRAGASGFDYWPLGIESGRSYAGTRTINPADKVRKFDRSRWYRFPPRWTSLESIHG